MIAAQPIPKYAKGTKDHKGGLAIVGDGGKQEAVVTDDGIFATPDRPTLVHLPKHAQVIPDLSYIYDRTGLGSDYAMLERIHSDKNGSVVNVNNDYSRLEKKMDGNTDELRKINRAMRRQMKNADYYRIYNRL